MPLVGRKVFCGNRLRRHCVSVHVNDIPFSKSSVTLRRLFRWQWHQDEFLRHLKNHSPEKSHVTPRSNPDFSRSFTRFNQHSRRRSAFIRSQVLKQQPQQQLTVIFIPLVVTFEQSEVEWRQFGTQQQFGKQPWKQWPVSLLWLFRTALLNALERFQATVERIDFQPFLGFIWQSVLASPRPHAIHDAGTANR